MRIIVAMEFHVPQIVTLWKEFMDYRLIAARQALYAYEQQSKSHFSW
jgi:hypothetical protein